MFSEIIGQESAIAAIQSSLISNQLSQTYLFVGEHQLGKTKSANALAQAVLCLKRNNLDNDACGICAACKSVELGTHPDVRSVRPSGPSRILRMAQFWPRDNVKDHPADKAMLRDLHFSPISGKRRVFIIECAESLNEDTANSLLKVLEEPPGYAHFILTALSIESVLPTIVSRSQSVRFNPVPQTLIIDELLNRGSSESQAAYLAAYAQGRPGIALRAIDSAESKKVRDEIVEVAAESTRGRSIVACFRIADDLRKTAVKLANLIGESNDTGDRTLLAGACDYLTYWYRDLLVRRSSNGRASVLNLDRLEEIDILCERYSVDELEYAIHLIQDTKRYIERNANAQIATEYLMVNLLSLGSLKDRAA